MINVEVSLPQRPSRPLTEIKFKKLHPNAILPRYAHGPDEDAGMDLVSIEHVRIRPWMPTRVKTGLAIELPSGMEGQVRSRSGLALKHGIVVSNAPGTLDPGYRGDIGVILRWIPTVEQCGSWYGESAEPAWFQINAGDKIAQLVIAPYIRVRAVLSDDLATSERGEGGFGSTGK